MDAKNFHNFDEYLVQSETSRRQKAEDWQIAIGLQAVDGLTPSDYLVQTAKRHIEGDISIDEVKGLIDTYYRTKSGHDAPDADTEEADKVSANITKLLNEQTFSFSPSGYAAVHKRIFNGVFKFAGVFRDCNITKKEWVLRGDTVLYVGFDEIRPALEHDFAREQEFCYKGTALPDIIRHLVKFISGLWQIHAFREGNTRTTAVFAVKYLRSMGFKLDSKMFREQSWYFRNALVRANYRNVTKGVEPEPEFLLKFFSNLLLGEQNELENHYLLITPPQRLAQASPMYSSNLLQVSEASNLFGENHGRNRNYGHFIDAAQGKIPADLVVKNVTMLMVTTGEWVRGDLAVADGRIVGAGPESYTGCKMIDGTGLWAVPGFIDSHVHVESCHALPFAFERAVLPHGTTTAICDPHELANVCGTEGIRFFLECAEKMRLDLIVHLSSCVPATPLETSGATLEAGELEKLMSHPYAGGLAELMNVPGLLNKDPGVLAKAAAFSDRIIDGHAPFLTGRSLNAYCGCGIGNDHECSTSQEANERIRRGMTVLIREGSVAKNLKALVPVVTLQNVDFTALCTDDRNILDILQEGHIDDLIRKLIAEGVVPELAYRAASLSAARGFRLYDRGILAPGKLADFVLLDDVKTCRIHAVFKKGENIAEKEFALPEIPNYDFALHSVKRAPLAAADFRIFSDKEMTPVIEITPGALTTKRIDLKLPLNGNGEKQAQSSRDIAKLCVVARHGINNNIGKGFVRGFGLQQGAIASSVGHDSHNLCIAGTTDEDMALAVNTLIQCGGGYSVVKEGKVLACVEFPVGGLMSEKGVEPLMEDLKKLYMEVKKTGCSLPDPFMQLAFLTLPVIPFLKITDKGVFDTEKSKFLSI